MRVFPKAIVLTTKSHFDVKIMYASIRGFGGEDNGLRENPHKYYSSQIYTVITQFFKLLIVFLDLTN